MLFIQGFLDIDDEPVLFFHKLSDATMTGTGERALPAVGDEQ